MDDFHKLAQGEHPHPLSVLGPHSFNCSDDHIQIVRAFCPDANNVKIIPMNGDKTPYFMYSVHPAGIFEGGV